MRLVLKKIVVLLILMQFHVCLSAQNAPKALFVHLHNLINNNYTFLDTDSSMRSDVALLRIYQTKTVINIEYASFNGGFKIGLEALKDSLQKKWIFKKELEGKNIYVPLVFILSDTYKRPDYSITDVIDFFRSSAKKSKGGKTIWLDPVLITKFERVN